MAAIDEINENIAWIKTMLQKLINGTGISFNITEFPKSIETSLEKKQNITIKITKQED